MIPVPIIQEISLSSTRLAYVGFKAGSAFLTWLEYRMVDGDPTRLEVVE